MKQATKPSNIDTFMYNIEHNHDGQEHDNIPSRYFGIAINNN